MLENTINNSHFQVVVRCKPLIKTPYQIQQGIDPIQIIFLNEDKSQITIKDVQQDKDKLQQNQGKKFFYNKIFGPEDDQEIIYSQIGWPLIESVMQGYHGTIFAYGQTGSGKTYTMDGKETPEESGIIPRACQHIFDHIESNPQIEYILKVSFFQIYNEKMFDLLSKSNKSLNIRQKPETGIYVENLSNFVVTSKEEIFKKMGQGYKNKIIGSTMLNSSSSRSHSIFQISIQRYDKTNPENVLNFGTLNFVDLAGSERIQMTGATGECLKEGVQINLSLSTLGKVMNQITQPNSKHVPYRESCLTRILQNSLGGNSKTIMITTISSDSFSYEGTLSSLRFAERAKQVKNMIKINKIISQEAIKSFREEYSQISSSRCISQVSLSHQSSSIIEEKKSMSNQADNLDQ